MTKSATLNQTYRNKAGATNVLSFPAFEALRLSTKRQNHRLLGDIIICALRRRKRAIEQKRKRALGTFGCSWHIALTSG